MILRMNLAPEHFRRILVLAAHPDDETIACSGLLQRCREPLVVFAVDGAPPHYGFAEQFGSLQQYSEQRFREAARALQLIPRCSFRRLARPDGTWLVDQHLFLDLPEAFACLHQIVREFMPDVLVSHAFEGGHIDHDACHILAWQVGKALAVPIVEFPLYWRDKNGNDVFQRFRDTHHGNFALDLSDEEIVVKDKMLSEYQTQRGLTSVFRPAIERFRPMIAPDCTNLAWPKYPFENRRRQLKAAFFLRMVADFHQSASLYAATSDRDPAMK
jgi:LmbE family N-acetylglucosaminyl deacetylase